MSKGIYSSQGFLSKKKTSMLTFSGSMHAHFSLTTYSATLKALSEVTDVAGMQGISLQSLQEEINASHFLATILAGYLRLYQGTYSFAGAETAK